MAHDKPDATMSLPVGPPAPPGEAARPDGEPLIGKTIGVVPLQASHAPSLYRHLGGEENAWRWTHMPSEGFPTYDAFEAAVAGWIQSRDPAFYVVVPPGPSTSDMSAETEKEAKAKAKAKAEAEAEVEAETEAVGLLAYVAITPEFRRIEIGHVILGEKLKRSRQATEAFYLFLGHAFDRLGYTRVEWKANKLNTPSLEAAARLGFSFDGIFRKHMIIKGRVRDTAWFGMTDDEWPVTKRGLETWLDDSNFDENGTQKKRLQECRQGG